jgi:hypothetical protein
VNSNEYMSEKELRLRQALGSNKFRASVGFHLTFAVTKIGFFSAGYVPVGTRDRKSGPTRFNPVKLSGGDLMKKMLFAAALIAALIPFAAAQDSHRLPQASLDREVDVQVPARAAVLGNPRAEESPAAPGYCKPCLFYAGDFDSNASDANGLANEFDIIVSSGAAVYAPFKVAKGKTWTVTGLFTDNFASSATLDPKTSPYEVRSKIPTAGGTGGKLVCHGKAKATNTDTKLNDFGFEVYATKVKVTNCTLKGGATGTKYWESVIPYCNNPNDSTCNNSYRAFEANDDGAMAHKFGPVEPANNSFFNSVFFGAVWAQSSGFQSSSRFSDGVIGTAK